MSAHSRVTDLIEIILNTVAAEADTTQDQLSVEVESVVTRGVLEAFKRGEAYAHDRPTDPPHKPTPPLGTAIPKIPKNLTPKPWNQPTVPVPSPTRRGQPPRRRRKDRRED